MFTPDMKDVIMMSNRGGTLGSWYDAGRRRGAADGVRRAGHRRRRRRCSSSPTSTARTSAADLYVVDGATGAIRRLTTLEPA